MSFPDLSRHFFCLVFLEAIPSVRCKLLRGFAFFQDQNGASSSRSFKSGKNATPVQKAFHFHQGYNALFQQKAFHGSSLKYKVFSNLLNSSQKLFLISKHFFCLFFLLGFCFLIILFG